MGFKKAGLGRIGRRHGRVRLHVHVRPRERRNRLQQASTPQMDLRGRMHGRESRRRQALPAQAERMLRITQLDGRQSPVLTGMLEEMRRAAVKLASCTDLDAADFAAAFQALDTAICTGQVPGQWQLGETASCPR